MAAQMYLTGGSGSISDRLFTVTCVAFTSLYHIAELYCKAKLQVHVGDAGGKRSSKVDALPVVVGD